MMEIKESNSQNAENLNDNHTVSEIGGEREKDSQDENEIQGKKIKKEKVMESYLSEKSTLRNKEQSKFCEEFIKPNHNEGWDMRISNIFSNSLFNSCPPYLTSPIQSSLNKINYNRNLEFCEKYGASNAEKKNKNIFFKTTKKNLSIEQKIKKEANLELKNISCVTIGTKDNFHDERQFLSKKSKFKENNIDLLLCNYFIYYCLLNIYLFLAASELLIKNGVLDEIEEMIKLTEKNSNMGTEKEKNFIDIMEASSSNSNSNSSTKYHNNKKNSKVRRKCQNQSCESQNKKVCKVDFPILTKKHGISWLCKLCLDAFKQNKYCYYCFSIYHSSTNDKKCWIQCDYCSCWNHVQCEETKGTYKNIMKNNIKGGLKYKCPNCREKVSSKSKPKNQCNANSGQRSRKVNQNYEPTSEYLKSNRKVTSFFDEKLPMSNHLYLLSSNDNREIYHDLMKIKNNQEII